MKKIRFLVNTYDKYTYVDYKKGDIKEFKDKSLLLELENKNTTGENVVLSIKYNKKENILTVCKEDYNNTYSYIQNYKISVKFNKIEYQKYGDFSETFLYK